MGLLEQIESAAVDPTVREFALESLAKIRPPDLPVEVYSGGDDCAIIWWTKGSEGLMVCFTDRISITKWIGKVGLNVLETDLGKALSDFVEKEGFG